MSTNEIIKDGEFENNSQLILESKKEISDDQNSFPTSVDPKNFINTNSKKIEDEDFEDDSNTSQIYSGQKMEMDNLRNSQICSEREIEICDSNTSHSEPNMKFNNSKNSPMSNELKIMEMHYQNKLMELHYQNELEKAHHQNELDRKNSELALSNEKHKVELLELKFRFAIKYYGLPEQNKIKTITDKKNKNPKDMLNPYLMDLNFY